ncbi:glycosyltransferase family 4 protein [Kocuria soli]|nr:glycosyltransferase family 4 protein [Kocuria soli]
MIVHLAANHGALGGGEVMLIRTAQILRDLGQDPHVVCPAAPADLADRAREAGFPVTTLGGAGTVSYLWALRCWATRHRNDLTWCHGLRPSLALAGQDRRFVHLHQIPRGSHRILTRVARWRASRTLVPSETAALAVPGAQALGNWTDEISTGTGEDRSPASITSRPEELTVGYLGRISEGKGVPELLTAFEDFRRAGCRSGSDGGDPGSPDHDGGDHDGAGHVSSGPRLLVGGAARFVPPEKARDLDRRLRDVPGVEPLGWIAPADLFERVDVLVCPSVAPESFGLVVAEAMVARVPVVATSVGALPEVLGTDHPLLVEPGDTAGLVRALDTFEAMSTRQRAELTDAQYDRWSERWSPSAGRRRVAALLGLPSDPDPESGPATVAGGRS